MKANNHQPLSKKAKFIHTLERTTGLTIAQYTALYEAQGGACAICGKYPKTRRLAVDHNHKTMKVRGLLCWTCNNGLGVFLDKKEVLASAICYLADNERNPKPYLYPKPPAKRRRGHLPPHE